MQSFFFLLLNILLLAVAFATGLFLFLWIAAAIVVTAITLLIRQKLTGKSPFLHVHTFRQSSQSERPTVIDAEFHEIDEK